MAAEIAATTRTTRGPGGASMRPRRMAAEIPAPRRERRRRRPRFNEAAANGRGNLLPPALTTAGERSSFNEAAANGRGNRARSPAADRRSRPASMRPRRMAAEIRRSVTCHPPCCCRFNEAAANGRGNRPARRRLQAVPGPASMRPRRMAAEIAPGAPRGGRAHPASMRPRRMAAEIVRAAAHQRASPALQ